ncbi:DUF6088 family protein [Halopseudomonas pelagia]|uniref:DUF6088 family protein n=1 Tax=Halopseudomonas pelagia TaxID=553151 RepID=UPI0026ACA42A|nr:DUF6088 family protein [Halopseudomonas pelagia]
MTIGQRISRRVKHMQKGKPFVGSLFAKEGEPSSVNRVLSRMVRAGALERVARRVYMRPKFSELVGAVRPSPLAIAIVTAKSRGETIQIHGAEVVRRLGLSTQIQVKEIYYTNGPTREIKIGNAVLRLQHVHPKQLQHAGTRLGVAVSALFYQKRAELTVRVAKKTLRHLSAEEIRL